MRQASLLSAVRVAVCVVLAVAAWPAATVGQPLQVGLERLIEDTKLADKLPISICVIDADSGRELASHKPDRPLIPASNMKLLTSGSALVVLGADFEFETRVRLADGPGGAIVILEGSGDPALGDPDLLAEMELTVEDLVDIWVDAIVRASPGGVAEVVADDRIFDRTYVHPTWPVAQLNRRYCCEVSGLNFHGNVLQVFTTPTSPGRPPELAMQPAAPWLEVGNKAKTVGKGKQHTAWAARAHGRNDITIYGDVRYSTQPIEVTLSDNGLHLARLVADRLGARLGGAPPARLADAAERLPEGEVLHTVRTTMATVLDRCNEDSENLYAESLLKRMGADVGRTSGTWNNGAAVVRMVLNDRLGATAGASIIVADGSGMSRENRVTTELLARWVRSLVNDPELSAAFLESLPVAGEEGTLRKRFRDDDPDHTVRAKSGYLSGVSALTGIVQSPRTGRRAIFSIVSNEKPNSVPLSLVRSLEERVVLLVDEWVASGDEAKLGG